VIAGVSVSAEVGRMDMETLPPVAAQVRECAAFISAALGHLSGE
jgi:DNA-binding IclR family transcriptional regulator